MGQPTPPEERVFYSTADNSVRITNTRAIIGGKTYAMSNITSVTIVQKKINIVLVVILALIGLASLFFIGQSPIVTLVIVAACAGLIFLLVRPSYAMRLGSASGESEALVSRNKPQVEQITSAMNEAIVHRG